MAILSSRSSIHDHEIHVDVTYVNDKIVDDELFIRKTIEENPQKGFELLYLKYYQQLCSHAIRFVHSRQIAEDLVSEVFYTLYQQGTYTRISSSYRAYLYKSVRNRGYNFIRWELDRNDSLQKASSHNVPEYDQPDMLTQYEELYQDLETAITALPLHCRDIYLQYQFEGKSYKEIASNLHISTRTVEVQIYRARQVIRKSLLSKWFSVCIAFSVIFPF